MGTVPEGPQGPKESPRKSGVGAGVLKSGQALEGTEHPPKASPETPRGCAEWAAKHRTPWARLRSPRGVAGVEEGKSVWRGRCRGFVTSGATATFSSSWTTRGTGPRDRFQPVQREQERDPYRGAGAPKTPRPTRVLLSCLSPRRASVTVFERKVLQGDSGLAGGVAARRRAA